MTSEANKRDPLVVALTALGGVSLGLAFGCFVVLARWVHVKLSNIQEALQDMVDRCEEVDAEKHMLMAYLVWKQSEETIRPVNPANLLFDRENHHKRLELQAAAAEYFRQYKIKEHQAFKLVKTVKIVKVVRATGPYLKGGMKTV